MYIIVQIWVYLLLAFALGMAVAWLLGLCTCKASESDENELAALRDERDSLASRLAASGSASGTLRDDARLSGLEAELAEARITADRQASEMAALKAQLEAAKDDDEAAAAMKWRNRYLETRVKFLEEGGAGAAVASGLAGAAVGAAIAGPATAASVGEPELDNSNFVPSPLAAMDEAELERVVESEGAGTAPKRTSERADPDDLLLIDGVGPQNLAWLNDNGIRYFWQIATMGASEVAWLVNNLPTFGSRVVRENWVRQAVNLARGLDPQAPL